MQICASTALHSAQRDNFDLKHKRAVFVTTRFGMLGQFQCRSRQLPASTRPFSFLSLLRQLRGLHKIRNLDRPCAEGASSRSWSRRSGCEAARRRARGAYCGGSLNVCALDVGALTYSLITFVQIGFFLPYVFPIERADYIGRPVVRQG